MTIHFVILSDTVKQSLVLPIYVCVIRIQYSLYFSECAHEGGSAICTDALHSNHSHETGNQQQSQQQFLGRSSGSRHSSMSAQDIPLGETTPFGHRGNMYYSFPQGFYPPNYTTGHLPVSAIPHSHSDSFHDRTFNFDPRRYFLPENVAQRQDRQLYDLNTAENRDNFHNFVLSGIHQHLYLVNINATAKSRQYQGADSNKQDASNSSDYCTNLATADPTSTLPGCTCTYITKSKSRIAEIERLQGVAGAKEFLKASVLSKSESEHESETRAGSSGQAEACTLNKSCAHNISSQIPVWQIQDEKEIETIHRLSSVSETDTENGVNYHIQSYQTDILGSDAGDISALSTSSQDSDLCSCGKLGLNHSHTNCSNLSTRGSSDVPSDLSSYDSNVYRSQSPAEMGHTQNEGNRPPHQLLGHNGPVSKSPINYDYNKYVPPVLSSQFIASNREKYSLHSDRYVALVAIGDSCAEKLPQLNACCSSAFSQPSITQYDSSPRRDNLKCDLSELNRNKFCVPHQAVPSIQRGKINLSDKNCIQTNSLICKGNSTISHNTSRPKFDLLYPVPAISMEIDNNKHDKYYSTSETNGKDRFTAKYSRNSEVPVSADDAARQSALVSDWYHSGSESSVPYYDHHSQRNSDATRNVERFQMSETNELTSLLNRTISVIPCSCASAAARNESDDFGAAEGRTQKVTGVTPLCLDSNLPQYLQPCTSSSLSVVNEEKVARSSSADHKSDECQICLSLQRISNLHRHAIQKGKSADHNLQRKNGPHTPQSHHTHPSSRGIVQETSALQLPGFRSLSSIVGGDEQLVTAIPSGAADELANVHDIHTSDEISISPSSSGSSSGERPKPFERLKGKTNYLFEGFQQMQAKDTIVVTNPKGKSIHIVSALHSFNLIN